MLLQQVRKTAAVCTAKLYDVNREMVEEQGFINTLRDLISDPNPMVRRICLINILSFSTISRTVLRRPFPFPCPSLSHCRSWPTLWLR